MPGNCADISPAMAAGVIGFLRAGGYIAFHGLAAYFERARVRAEGLGDFGFFGGGKGRRPVSLCRLGLAGTEFYVLLVLELDGGELSADKFGMETGGRHVLFGVEGSKGGFAVSFRS